MQNILIYKDNVIDKLNSLIYNYEDLWYKYLINFIE
jgi:hypothetical protein